MSLTDDVVFELWKAVFDARAERQLRESWVIDIVPKPVCDAWARAPFTPSGLRGFLDRCLWHEAICEWRRFLDDQAKKSTNPWAKHTAAEKALTSALRDWPGERLQRCSAETWNAIGLAEESAPEAVKARIAEHLQRSAVLLARQAIDAAVRTAIRQQREGKHGGTAS